MLIQVMSVKVWKANPIEFGIIESSIPIGYMLGAGIIIFLIISYIDRVGG